MVRTTALTAVLLGLSLGVAHAAPPPPPTTPAKSPPAAPAPAAPAPAPSAPDAPPPADPATPTSPPADAAGAEPAPRAPEVPKETATLVGVLYDLSSKKTLPGVDVAALSPELPIEQNAVTDASGEYRFAELPPGEYTIRYEKEGYKPSARGGVQLKAGSTLRVNTALARESIKAQEIVTVGLSMSARERSMNSVLLPPKTLQVGGDLTFLISDSSPKAGEQLDFTDVGLLTLNSRYSFGPVELALASDLLIKQPSYMDEWVPQAGSLTALIALGEQQALGINGGIGPLLEDKGRWESATLSLHAKRVVHETLVFKGALGGNFTHLGLAANPQQAFWFSEIVVGLEAILRSPIPMFAGWVGADLHIPVAKNPDGEDPDPAGYLDPQIRLNFVLAAAYSFVRDWDLVVRFAFIDRGDKDNPQSTLPILNGGFDQQQITIGVVHDFSFDDR